MMDDHNPDWQEICERYPFAGVLGPQENHSITPVQKLDTFEKTIIALTIVALIGVLLTH